MMGLNRLEIIKNLLLELKEPNYRMRQITDAIYQKNSKSYSEISTIPLELRSKLQEKLGGLLSISKVGEVKDSQAHKILFTTRDGYKFESVKLTYLPTKDRPKPHVALCVSCQSGCALNCSFCATGAIGFKKNLTIDEITDQFLYFRQLGEQIDSIIFMGMGEPFENPVNVFGALDTLSNPNIFNFSLYRISISTIGVIRGIKKLTAEYPQVNLAFSLHSPFSEQRTQIMPVNERYPMDLVLQAVHNYVKTTNNKVFISYLLLGGVNDSKDHAHALAEIIKATGKLAYLYHVNLIRYNPGPCRVKYNRSSPDAIRIFQNILNREKVNNTLRQDFGVNIDAACGQLWAKLN
jgi:23S rRNA (adenine-C8)-methyltransferase